MLLEHVRLHYPTTSAASCCLAWKFIEDTKIEIQIEGRVIGRVHLVNGFNVWRIHPPPPSCKLDMA
jgi:hypothetical protein